MGFCRTPRGRSFVYHAGTPVEGVGGTCGSLGGMVSWPRSWHTPCRAWYWCQATRCLRSTRSVRGMWSHRDCGMRRQETWCRPAADALFHQFRYRILPCSPDTRPHVAKCDFPTHAVDEAFVDSGTVVEGTYGAFGGGMVPRRARPIPSYLARQPFDSVHTSVPAHRQQGHPVRTGGQGGYITPAASGVPTASKWGTLKKKSRPLRTNLANAQAGSH